MNETRSEKNLEIAEEIENEERKLKNKKIFKILFWIFIPLFIIFSISYTLLRFVGNMGITVREYALYYDNLPNDFEGIKIVQFSDIHYNKYSSIDRIEKIVKLINKTNPDIVIFTGDLIDMDYDIDSNTKEKIIAEFNKIDAKIGKYAIKGEEDSIVFKEIFDNSGFNILENKIEKIYIESSYINLIALDNKYSSSELETIDNSYFSIATIHAPDLSDRIVNDFKPNLIIAGHSHNGQIILPIIGPIMKKEGAKKYISSYYNVNGTDLYISGGLGNSKYEFRLFNHPSINFYRLRHSK